jgi:hypothetical protein
MSSPEAVNMRVSNAFVSFLKTSLKKTCWLGLHNAKAFGITNPVSERGSSGLKVQVG